MFCAQFRGWFALLQACGGVYHGGGGGMGVGAVREAACMPQGGLEVVGERGEIESQ